EGRGRDPDGPWGNRMTARAIELHMDITTEGSARLEIVEVDDVGQEFVVDLVGPEAEVRAEAAFLAEQYHLAAIA
ncbi:MAG TPA: hypothetical protein PKX25_16470, partial [Microthrixaceae bacterium]|nr:hypothetical protein [Microthrixaceae bacterium]